MIVRAGIFFAFGLMLAPMTAQAGEVTVVLSVHHADCVFVRHNRQEHAGSREGREHRFGQPGGRHG